MGTHTGGLKSKELPLPLPYLPKAGTVPAVNSIGGDTAAAERARVIPDEAVVEDQAAPKRKRSDDYGCAMKEEEWR
eukprot:CAMPEP_0181089328 /NCGR_PEP_ID=MMETSP1071-20121207/7245_1 /TAXON_ID=35127 /ORGANISM="Thalassiosira sp., Strain NH16" /LENGTH=75 /DNA_ID=CAMNT_0023171271 /DNA_START=116 /DNA_END=343 /DNA_ORIENTATION=-